MEMSLRRLFGVAAAGVLSSIAPLALANEALLPAGIPSLTLMGTDMEEIVIADDRNTTDCWWLNGNADSLGGLISQTLNGFSARVADDFILEAGQYHLVDQICVCMAVQANVTDPDVCLELYSDCNGSPDTLLITYCADETTSVVETNLGPIAAFPGYNLWEFCFQIDRFDLGDDDGCSRFWLSPFGRGLGSYFWLSSNNGIVQGHQGVFRNTVGISDWTNVDEANNFFRCTDFCFRICGKVCFIIKDQGNYDLAGLTSIKFPNVIASGSRSADNFQISSRHISLEVCRIEAYLATNCDPEKVFGEIYGNNCDLPSSLLYTLSDPEITETGETFSGLPVYCFRFDCPGIILAGGVNYWFSIVAVGGGALGENAVFLYRLLEPGCMDIHITEGVYRNDFAGFSDFTPVSHEDLAGVPRDFAFRIYGAIVKGPVGSSSSGISGDANGDGNVNFFDVLDVLRNWGASE
jgi:hypothetical protein